MTTPQIQIACAKACGWKLAQKGCHPRTREKRWQTVNPEGRVMSDGYEATMSVVHLPHYHESHDAMTEALGTMTEEEWEGYVVALHNETVSKLMSYNRTVGAMLRATPLQQAVAFLKTKNLYHE